MELSQTEIRNGIGAASYQWEIALIVWLQIVERNTGEIGDDYKTRNFLETSLTGQIFDVGKALRLGDCEGFASGFVFHKKHAAPQQIDVVI